MNPKIHSYLGLSMRAGKLISGDEKVLKAIRSGEAKLIVLAEDASPNSSKKFTDKCSSYRVPLIQCCSRSELGDSIGRDNRVVAAITDVGFAKMIQKALENQTEV
jgi:ribosomal protein L7Ae-like RNA K-turn-binding protein